MARNPAPRRPRSGLPLLAALAAALLFAACGDSTPELTAPQSTATQEASSSTEGRRQPAPALQVTLFDGSTFDLGEHLSRDGRPVVLNLWASWCPPCRDEMPHFDAAARRHPEILFLGVAVRDDPEAAAATVAELALSYALGADLDGSVDAAFPSPGLPATFLIGSDGTLLGAVYGGLEPEDIEALVDRYLAG
ncbi:MAG: TlpA family protein disulfide reductase [Acidimicrobiia bacterium]|jgi:thiol-disulfide isomerase/thioredoxin|nr:TlpA family protein disulfide reductase [Acidimicrobiia bacterium]